MLAIFLPLSLCYIQKSNPVEYISADHLGPFGKLVFLVEMNTSLFFLNTSLLYKVQFYIFRISFSN